MKKVLFSLVAVLLLSLSGIAQTTYTMVNSASQLEAGAKYVLVGYDNDGQAFIMSYQKSNNRHALAIDEAGGVITATVATDPSQQDAPFEFTLDGAPGAWTIYDPLNNGYLYAAGGGNYLRTQTDLTDNGRWTITDGDEGGMVPVSNGGVEQCYMRYNITSTLFGCYKESSNVAAPVYFFKAGGAAEPDPEPSNYPTDFYYLGVGTDIILTWTDATGAQLPHKYLILASTGNITVPTDGTPVADGILAKNVPYGTQVAEFTGLQGGTTYHFAIFPYTNSGSNIDYKTDGNYPIVTATTEEIYTLLFEDFDEDLGVFTAYDMYGDQGWHQGSYQGTTYAVCNGYANQTYNENEDWLISPAISSNGYQDAILSFRTAMKFDGDPLQVKVSVDYDGQSEPTDFDWVDITDAFDFSTGNYEWVESGDVDIWGILDGYALGYPDSYVAFVYKSSSESASSWEIDYVKVVSYGTEAVEENNQTIGLYPNPAREQVSFTLESDAQVSIFDMTGRKVSETECKAGQTQLDVNELVNGVYFVNFRFVDGTSAVSKFVKF
ncbi:MAG: choice-of-anchor J domain-containing protein [Bacteroidales bacterium]|nr:choice-of-anchor J domain-containing protein [Bacteroidales bacterium]